MALPHFITQKELNWLIESTLVTSKNKDRDLCLIAMFVGTPCFVLELNRIQIGDILNKNGKLKKQFFVRCEKDSNGEDRHIYISSNALRNIIQSYLNSHKAKGEHPDYYLGLDHEAPLFDFSITSRAVDDKTSYAASSLGNHIKKLLRDGGIEQPSALSGRRTFANRLHAIGMDVSYIHHLLGNKMLETTRKLLINNAVDMGSIAARAF